MRPVELVSLLAIVGGCSSSAPSSSPSGGDAGGVAARAETGDPLDWSQ